MTQSAHEEDLVRDDELLFDRLREPSSGNGHIRTRESVREGDVLAGKYSVERLRRRSGSLLSAEARHVDLGERVLMMLLPTDGHTYPDTVARFLRDARAAAKIRSEHAARITDVGWLVSGSPYAVSEFPGGSDLADLLRGRGPLPVAEALDYVVQACDAVVEAHALDIVHASLNPANILVSRGTDGLSIVKVLGFGISETWLADPADSRSTGPVDPGSLAQALAYFAPEQIRDPSALDARADVWALGAILYELLTGQPVFRSRSMLALATMIAADQPSAIGAVRSDVPRELEDVILTCLAKDPDARFANVGDLTQALKPFASPEGHSSLARISRISGLSSRPPVVTQRLTLPLPSPPPVAPPSHSLTRPLPTPTPPPLPRSQASRGVSSSRSVTTRRVSPPPASAQPPISSAPKAVRTARFESMSTSYGPAESDSAVRWAKHLPWVAAAILGVGAAVILQSVMQRQAPVARLDRPVVPAALPKRAEPSLDLTLASPAPTSAPAPVAAPATRPAPAAPAPRSEPAPRPVARSTPSDFDAPAKPAPGKRSKGLFDDAD